jgi:hypothetical protein
VQLALSRSLRTANVFVYGIRVLKRPETPVSKALNPLGVEPEETRPPVRQMPEERMS